MPRFSIRGQASVECFTKFGELKFFAAKDLLTQVFRTTFLKFVKFV